MGKKSKLFLKSNAFHIYYISSKRYNNTFAIANAVFTKDQEGSIK